MGVRKGEKLTWKEMKDMIDDVEPQNSTYVKTNVRIVLKEIIEYLESIDVEFKASSQYK